MYSNIRAYSIKIGQHVHHVCSGIKGKVLRRYSLAGYVVIHLDTAPEKPLYLRPGAQIGGDWH